MTNTPIEQTLFRVVSEAGEPIGLADFDDLRKAFKVARACAKKGRCSLILLRVEQVTHYYAPVHPEDA